MDDLTTRGTAKTDVRIERTPDGRRVCVAREVDAPAEVLWDLLRDTRRWPEWGPSVSAVQCDVRQIESGTTGQVKVANAVWLPFEITSCRDRRWTWRVARIPATGHRVEGERPCEVIFELPLLAAAYVPVCERALEKLAEMAGGDAVAVESVDP